MTAFMRGVDHALSGFSLLLRPRLRRFVVVPFIVNVVLFVTGAVLLIDWIGTLSAALTEWLPDWLDWLSYLLWPLMLLIFVGVVLVGFTAIANLLGAPFNGVLAERCAALLGGEPSAPGKPLWQEVGGAIRSELQKLAYYLLRALPLALLSLVPGIGLLASLGLLALTVWMLGIGYLDYPLGNAGLAFREQRRLLSQRRLLVLGFGGTIFALTLVPVVNFVVMPAAVCGATRLWLHEQNEFVK